MGSRLTYRKKVSEQAWQYEIRKKRERDWLASGRKKFWETLDLSINKSVVKEVPRVVAEKIIHEYEWLGDMAVTNKYYGIFFGNYCGGVVCLNTYGHTAHGERQFKLSKGDVTYFARGACVFWTPVGSASRLISMACKLEKKRGARLAIAYADSDAGEYGTVYQASNWFYIGLTDSHLCPQFVKGSRVMDYRVFSKHRSQYGSNYEKTLIKNGWIKQMSNPKMRYVRILADRPHYNVIYKAIQPFIKPYPKRSPIIETNNNASEA